MLTTQTFLKKLREKYRTVELSYLQPSLYVFCEDDKFQSLSHEQRVEVVSQDCIVNLHELIKLTTLNSIDFIPVTKEERNDEYGYVPKNNNLSHWLPILDEKTRKEFEVGQQEETVRAIHFYGYKGGQARSTTLCAMASSLAEDGYNVLIVDADLEAPSMTAMVSVSTDDVSNTLMGLCGWADEINPIRIERLSSAKGNVDLIACRPDSLEFNMDFAAFALRASMDTSVLVDGVNKLKDYVNKMMVNKYDIVLFDHRTGISLSVLPVIETWPGSVVVNIRMDGLSEKMHALYSALFSVFPETPGAYISFSLDPNDTHDKIESNHIRAIDKLLDNIANNIIGDDNNDLFVNDEVLKTYWINWFHDRAYLKSDLPKLKELSNDNLNSIGELRNILELSSSIDSKCNDFGETNHSLSGAKAEDLFIETRAIQNLFQEKSPYTYILGRKGTGKTRLFRQFITEGLAEPLLTTNDYDGGGGISSNQHNFDAVLESIDKDYKSFWWAILYIVLDSSDAKDDAAISASVKKWLGLESLERKRLASQTAIIEKIRGGSNRRSFVIDGVETAVASKEIRDFVESLFMFMLNIQSEKSLNNNINIRLFLRSDLQVGAVQNIEQQVANKKIDLTWNKDAIFNFLLAKISSNYWFGANFPDAVAKIKSRSSDIKKGLLTEAEYKEYIHDIFPKKIRRNNLLTYTFFTTYFSDTSSDKENSSSFYPRLFESFLISLEALCKEDSRESIVEGRVNHIFLLEAHTKAAGMFMDEMTQELHNVLELDDNSNTNKDMVEQLIAAFDGRATPFDRNDMAHSLTKSLFAEPHRIKAALESMKKIGIFEERTGYPGEWRAGGLYKHGLRMKYVRGNKGN